MNLIVDYLLDKLGIPDKRKQEAKRHAVYFFVSVGMFILASLISQ